MPIAEAKEGKFELAVAARGTVASSKENEVVSQVEGVAKVISQVQDQKKVKKGDLVVELDSAALREILTNQRIASQRAEAAYQNAKLTREVAEIAVREYQQGVYPAERAAMQGELQKGGRALQRTETRFERTRQARARLRDLISSQGHVIQSADILAEVELDNQLDSIEQARANEQLAMEMAQGRLATLTDFTAPKMQKQLEAEVEKARYIERREQLGWENERRKEHNLESQIRACKLYAPCNGILVHANDPNRGEQPSLPIQEGSLVSQDQLLFRVLELGPPLLIDAQVGEPRIDRVMPGQKTRVEIDAFPDRAFSGTVIEVAPRPDALALTRGYKLYRTVIKLDGDHPGLVPGMSARAEIVLAERDRALTIPIDAILEFQNKYHVAVKTPDGTFVWREVTVGEADDRTGLAEVKEGIRPGDQVALKPSELLSEFEKRQKGLGPSPKPAKNRGITEHSQSAPTKK
jgi:multidrug efflux pump subunit AcrA (membrane-fusion protein)